MADNSITVLGGGNTAFGIAANLTLRGYEITLYEVPEFSDTLEPLKGNRGITLNGVAEVGEARIHKTTTDIAEALGASRLVLIAVPAYAHKPFAQVCADHVRDGQMLVVMPGTLGSLEFARIFREKGAAEGVILAETDTSPYVCRKTAPAEAHIWGTANMGLGVLPASKTADVAELLEDVFPGVVPLSNVMACGLGSMNPVVHPAGVLMNAGRIEYSRGEFYFYDEGVTPGVVRVIEKVDEERRAIGQAVGVELCTVAEGFHRAGFGPKGNLWEVLNGSRMLTQLKAPLVLENRWLTEDTPYGLGAWASMGEQFNVATPAIDSIIELASIITQLDCRTAGRTVRELGIEGMDKGAIRELLG